MWIGDCRKRTDRNHEFSRLELLRPTQSHSGTARIGSSWHSIAVRVDSAQARSLGETQRGHLAVFGVPGQKARQIAGHRHSLLGAGELRLAS
jgi:hypothetical protein